MKLIRPNAIADAGGTYTRAAGTATYFNSSGVQVLGSTNVPRENYVYDEVSGVYRLDGVLIEPSKTNLFLQSATLDNASWLKANTTVTANAITAPDATLSADKVVETAVTNTHAIYQTFNLTSGVQYTYSIYLKAAERSWAFMQFPSNVYTDALNRYVYINISNGTLGNYSTDLDIRVQNCGNGWYRLTVTTTCQVTVSTSIGVYTSISGSGVNYTGDGTSGIYAWGAQLETGTLTSYIPTTTTTVTRPADTVTGTGFHYSSIAEDDHTAWNAGTAYIIGDRVIRTTATTHKVYERVVAGTTATAPESDAINWIAVSPTNRWKLFDESPSTITVSASETMSYILKPGRANSFSALEVDATEIAINVYISGERVYSGYTNMLNNENVGNWYEYFYEPFYYQTAVAATDMLNAALLELPASTDMIVTVTLRKAGGTSGIGALVLGIVYELGKTQNGMSLSIVDYSKKDTDSYGNTVLIRRKYSKRVQATFFLYSNKVDVVSNLLTQYRATPVVWIGADNQYNSLVIYGFYRDWNIGIPNNIGSTCSIEIEGLA